MAGLQQQYDDAMFAFSQGDYAGAATRLRAILAADPAHFDAQLSLGMALCRLGDFPAAIAEGHKAETLAPQEQLVHTSLSLFYLKVGNKAAAEHHALRARISSWKGNMAPPAKPRDTDLDVAQNPPAPLVPPEKFPDQPWKKRHSP